MESPLPAGLSVISPTWFNIEGSTLEVTSLADEAYVEWAHGQGVSVWPRVFDGSGEISHAFLTDAQARKRAVSQLASYAESLNVDGINVDLEYVQPSDGGYYIQFLRELRVALGDRLLSADVLVPQAWSEYYRRGDIALTADFVCLMAFDEHYLRSPTSGPVASLTFVDEGVTNTLKEVPKEQLIMGLPFYSRVWRELANNDSPDTRETTEYYMESAKQRFIEHSVQPEWDKAIGCFYGEYAAVEDDTAVLYRAWFEDEHSIEEKLKIFSKYDLAGVCGWARGFENNAVHVLLQEACGTM
jgi:spore germination protein YaaH